MRFQVCTVSPTLARAWASARERIPFLPPPVAVADPGCACGQPLDMEMERTEGRCVNCAFQAAEAAYRAGRAGGDE